MTRADKLVFQRGLAKSRIEAKSLILEGGVLCDGVTVKKPSENLPDDAEISVTKQTRKYISRGGLKLEGAVSAFDINVEGAVCADIGASTGGFTDFLLKNGAKKVYAIENGHGQLDISLVNDSRVINMEGINARYLEIKDIGEYCDIAVMDVSFISQTLIHSRVYSILKPGGIFISLVKPQFEAGRENLGKRGIATPKAHEIAKQRVVESALATGFEFRGMIRSPIDGGDGNVEFLAYFIKKGECGG